MIISKDTNPKKDLYYLGAKIIEILSLEESMNVDFFLLFDKLKKSDHISIDLFTLTLDWLYLIGAIKNSKQGDIIKCF